MTVLIKVARIFFIESLIRLFIKWRQIIFKSQQNYFVCLYNAQKIRAFNFSLLFGVSFVGLPLVVHAEENQWRLCTAPTETISLKNNLIEEGGISASKEMIFTADKFEIIGSEYHLQGKVKGGRGDQQLLADSLNYDKNTDVAQAVGNVRYMQGDLVLTGDNAKIDIGKNSGSIQPARFWLTDKHIRGRADLVQFEGDSRTHMQDVIFTTCDEGSDDWLLKASSLRLDTENNVGVAQNARINFMGVPIFYFPYLSFPLEGRKSGFLVPAFGDSSNSGTEVSVPYYWNIAPHRDATLTPKYLSRRGLMVETEFRYLNEKSHGQIEVAHLNDDRVFGEDRTAVSLRHKGAPAKNWRTQLQGRHVSDGDYLDDFSSDLATSSTTHLENHAFVDYRNKYIQASLLVQDYQTLDETLPGIDKPYQRLPQIRINSQHWKGPAGFMLGFDAEAVRFDRSEGVIGNRLDVQPMISWPWRGLSSFVIPKLAFRHTQYQLSRSALGVDDSPSRSLSIFSLDSGLFFERELQVDASAKRQTLEPRLFFLHVPYRNQENLIVDELGADRVFDTSTPLFSFSQMFRDNRFSGADRVGDANQLAAALTTRYLDRRGRELLSASVGRTFYFQDREVTLPGGTPETDAVSDWLAEIKSQWTPSLSARASLQWGSGNGKIERGSANIRYLKDKRRVLRLSYRFEENSIEQRDMAFIWPVSSHWSLVGRWLHSIRDDVTLETLKGVEYESCCWTARLVQRSYRVDALDEDENSSIWIQLELKGLTSVGKGIKSLLARDIISP